MRLVLIALILTGCAQAEKYPRKYTCYHLAGVNNIPTDQRINDALLMQGASDYEYGFEIGFTAGYYQGCMQSEGL